MSIIINDELVNCISKRCLRQYLQGLSGEKLIDELLDFYFTKVELQLC